MADQGGLTLGSLPTSIIEKILLLLDTKAVILFGQTSRIYNDIALSELFWLRILEKQWGHVTRPGEWLVKRPLGYFELFSSKHKYPGSYRALYPILRDYEQIVGVWRDADRNALCVFQWQNDCIQGTVLLFDSMDGPPKRKAFLKLSSEGRVSMDLQMGQKHCWLREYNLQEGHLLRLNCQKAEAAASVAIGRNPVSPEGHVSADSSHILGTSPQGSFEHELLRFMQMNVSSKRRRSRSRSPSQGGHPGIKDIYHLRHVPLAMPTRAHPLTGMWKGDFGLHWGIQIITISYDFSRRLAIIKANKVGGHQDAFHEQPVWMSSAQPCSSPFTLHDQLLIARRAYALTVPEAHAGVSAGTDTSLDPNAGSQIVDKTVLNIFKGKGRMLNTEDWYDGRLWQYRDGSIGFLCIGCPDIGNEGYLVDFVRVSHELEA